MKGIGREFVSKSNSGWGEKENRETAGKKKTWDEIFINLLKGRPDRKILNKQNQRSKDRNLDPKKKKKKRSRNKVGGRRDNDRDFQNILKARYSRKGTKTVSTSWR